MTKPVCEQTNFKEHTGFHPIAWTYAALVKIG